MAKSDLIGSGTQEHCLKYLVHKNRELGRGVIARLHRGLSPPIGPRKYCPELVAAKNVKLTVEDSIQRAKSAGSFLS
jgi:hypothetical protein